MIRLPILICWLLALLGHSAVSAQTYVQDVAPIIQSKCAGCHRDGEAAPFNLLTYEDVAKRASFIKEVVQSRYMPPWRADNDYVHFDNDRTLSEKDIQTIVSWVDAGVKEGKRKGREKNQAINRSTDYGRAADMTLVTADTFLVKGNNRERFVEFKIPFELDQSFDVEAIEFYSNNKKLIHHVNYAVQVIEDLTVDINAAPAMANHTDGEVRYTDPYKRFKQKMAYYGGWIPGAAAEAYPPKVGWKMPKRGVILLTVHFSATPIDEFSVNGVHLFFTDVPVEREVKVVSFGSGGIGELDIQPSFFMIPADKVSHYTLKFKNPGEDLSLLYIWPHMHYIGKSFKVYATLENNDTIPLVNIPDWDYRWQEMYRYKHFKKIPKGAVIHMECAYDNTANNPFNPFVPPQNIFSYSNMKSDQEMMTLLMIYLPYQPNDEKQLTSLRHLP
ncbi:cytochrome c [Sphingobacterium sp. lm-10]|uniref:c-type cytochrome n=1 Tax=Sphingobacterium sp. lm-10 TaxID=2944904 RepID=UPI0020202B5D|nr:cytochrome c [Sphingobacterium sp. lm-10]MCL7987843.1 cytochrome c [Sphingobacterium sp. lm-10]